MAGGMGLLSINLAFICSSHCIIIILLCMFVKVGWFHSSIYFFVIDSIDQSHLKFIL